MFYTLARRRRRKSLRIEQVLHGIAPQLRQVTRRPEAVPAA
jgi:hypothetical protein